MNGITLSFILFFTSLSIYAQNLDSLANAAMQMDCTEISFLDSVANILFKKTSPENSTLLLAKAHAIKSKNSFCMADYKNVISEGRKSVSFFRKLGFYEEEANVLSTMAAAFRKFHEIDSALDLAKRMYQIGLKTGNKRLEANAYLNFSSSFVEDHQHDSVLYYCLKALEISSKNPGLLDFEAGILHNMGIAYSMGGDLEAAKNTFLEALEKYKQDGYKNGKPNNIYAALGRGFVDLKKYDSSIIFYNEGLQYANEIDNDFMRAYLYRGLGKVKMLQKEYQRAIFYNQKALEISENRKLTGNTAVTLDHLVECYLNIGDYKRAIFYGEEALQNVEDSHNRGTKKQVLFNLALAYEKDGKLSKTVDLMKQLRALEEELNEQENAREFARLNTKYETEKKEVEIASLTQQASIQALEIKQKNQAIIIGIVVVLFILLAIYFLYKQRESRKEQLQTELEQRFLRSQLNPHFISNALVSVQNFMFKHDGESAALYLAKFSKLMREILENSRRAFIPVEQEISMLRNYLDIHKIRLETFDYTIDVSDEIDPATDTIPPMFVQPFLENAIEHGIGQTQQGKIDLKFRKEQDYIAIEIKDNGDGFKVKTKTDRISLSSTIIKERIDLFNKTLKNKIKLEMDNLKDEKGQIAGAKVALKVPFSYI